MVLFCLYLLHGHSYTASASAYRNGKETALIIDTATSPGA